MHIFTLHLPPLLLLAMATKTQSGHPRGLALQWASPSSTGSSVNIRDSTRLDLAVLHIASRVVLLPTVFN